MAVRFRSPALGTHRMIPAGATVWPSRWEAGGRAGWLAAPAPYFARAIACVRFVFAAFSACP